MSYVKYLLPMLFFLYSAAAQAARAVPAGMMEEGRIHGEMALGGPIAIVWGIASVAMFIFVVIAVGSVVKHLRH